MSNMIWAAFNLMVDYLVMPTLIVICLAFIGGFWWVVISKLLEMLS